MRLRVRSCSCNGAHDQSQLSLCRCLPMLRCSREALANVRLAGDQPRFAMAWESAGGTGGPPKRRASTSPYGPAGSTSVLVRAIRCRHHRVSHGPRKDCRCVERLGGTPQPVRLGDFLPRAIVFHMSPGFGSRLCRSKDMPLTRNRRHPMRTILLHAEPRQCSRRRPRSRRLPARSIRPLHRREFWSRPSMRRARRSTTASRTGKASSPGNSASRSPPCC